VLRFLRRRAGPIEQRPDVVPFFDLPDGRADAAGFAPEAAHVVVDLEGDLAPQLQFTWSLTHEISPIGVGSLGRSSAVHSRSSTLLHSGQPS
jgi:hypothetical protein